jgi:hypothetical protein
LRRTHTGDVGRQGRNVIATVSVEAIVGHIGQIKDTPRGVCGRRVGLRRGRLLNYQEVTGGACRSGIVVAIVGSIDSPLALDSGDGTPNVVGCSTADIGQSAIDHCIRTPCRLIETRS